MGFFTTRINTLLALEAWQTTVLPKLPTPGGLTVQPVTGSNNASWNAVSGAGGYRLQRAPVAGGTTGSYGTVYEGPATTYQDTTSTPNSDYDYRVRALAGSGTSDSDYSAAVRVHTASATPMPPVWSFDSNLRILTLGHANYDASQLEYSYKGSAYQQYTAGLSVDDNAHPVGDWLGRVKAATGRPVSDTAASRQIEAKGVVVAGLTRLDLTMPDFSAVNRDTKTPVTATFSNGAGGTYPAEQLYSGPATLKIRGNSTAALPKKPFALSLTDSAGADAKFPVLGMYTDNDFVLLAEYQDPTYLRTYFSQEISRGLGLKTVQTRPLEIYINNEYYGLFTITEKIKQSLLGIATLGTGAADQSQPNLSGGYLWQKQLLNQVEAGENLFQSTYYNDYYTDVRNQAAHGITIDYPKSTKITAAQTAAGQQYVLDAEATLTNRWVDAATGPQSAFDAQALLRSYLAEEFSQSLDDESHSNYFYKDRGGKIFLGPLWDRDITFVTYTYYAFLPNHATADYIWQSNGWANKLYADRYFADDFAKLYVQQGRAVITNAWQAAQQRAQLLLSSGAIDRNNAKWGVNTTQYAIPISTGVATDKYEDHLQLLADFVQARLAHFDATYVPLGYTGAPAGNYRIEATGYTTGNPQVYPGLSWLPAAPAVTVLILCKKPPTAMNTQTLFSIAAGPVVGRQNSLLYETTYGAGLNTFTPADDTFDNKAVLDDDQQHVWEAVIYNNNAAALQMLLDGQALPHSVKPAGATLDSTDFGDSLVFGYLRPDLPQFDWIGLIPQAFVYEGVAPDAIRTATRQFLLNNKDKF